MLEGLEPLNVWLYTRDLEAARRFYAEGLGLSLWREEPKRALHFGVGGIVLSIGVGEPRPPEGAALVFTVASGIEHLCEALRERGVRLEQPVSDRANGRSAMIRDPDGRELWLLQPSAVETQFHSWRLSRRARVRRVPVQRRPKLRRHERPPPSRRRVHPNA